MKELLKEKLGHDVNKIFFLGCGGTSMSGLMTIARDMGFEVVGSNDCEKQATIDLAEAGMEIHIGHSKDNVPEDVDLLVHTAAVDEDNAERIRATELGIPQMERSKFLGTFSRLFDTTIGVAGTHGKTTTSSMIAFLLFKAGLDPSVSIGGQLDEIGGNNRLGSKDYFVVESCEFRDSFLTTSHKIGVITSIGLDHLDYFTGGIEQIKDSFEAFGRIIPKDGLMVACGDSKEVREVCDRLDCPVAYYGLDEDNEWVAKNIVYTGEAQPTFDVYHNGEYFGTFSLIIHGGTHNVQDAMAAIIVAHTLGVDTETISKELKNFTNAHRRFELDGIVNNIKVFNDYAHVPEEIECTLQTASNYDHNRIWIVFQPHTYSRVKKLFWDFVNCFEGADLVVLNDIFSDREKLEKYDIYSEDIAKYIKRDHNKPTVVFKDFDNIVKFIVDNAVENDLILVVGSQSIVKVSKMLVEALKEKYE